MIDCFLDVRPPTRPLATILGGGRESEAVGTGCQGQTDLSETAERAVRAASRRRVLVRTRTASQRWRGRQHRHAGRFETQTIAELRERSRGDGAVEVSIPPCVSRRRWSGKRRGWATGDGPTGSLIQAASQC